MTKLKFFCLALVVTSSATQLESQQRSSLSESTLDSIFPLRSYEARARRAGIPMPSAPSFPLTASPPADTIGESEPNQPIALAQTIPFDVVVSGSIEMVGATDFFAVEFQEGAVVDIDIDAQSIGELPNFRFELYDTDESSLGIFEDYIPAQNQDPRAIFDVPATGIYKIGVAASGVGAGSAIGDYNLKVTTFPSGPGDPTTLVSNEVGVPFGMAADAEGNLLATDQLLGRIVIVDNVGEVTELLTDLGAILDVVEDGFGNLLVSGFSFSNLTPSIWSFDESLAQSTFTTDITAIGPIAIGPDGDVWAADSEDRVIRRFSPLGELVESVALGAGAFGVFDIEFSPGGVLHYSDGLDRIFRVVDGTSEEVIATRQFVDGIAFDEDGYLYVANGFEGRILLFDPNYQLVEDPFANRHMRGPMNLVFDRATDGTTNSRLLVANNLGSQLPPEFDGAIIEMNPTGMRAPGADAGLTFASVELDDDGQSAILGAPFTAQLETAIDGPVTWSIVTGGLPDGLILEVETGIISGTPLENGSFAVFLRGVGTGGGVAFGSVNVFVTFPAIAVGIAADLLLGVPGLNLPEILLFLDAQGNGNGVYDIGDFRRYVLRGDVVIQAPPFLPPQVRDDP